MERRERERKRERERERERDSSEEEGCAPRTMTSTAPESSPNKTISIENHPSSSTEDNNNGSSFNNKKAAVPLDDDDSLQSEPIQPTPGLVAQLSSKLSSKASAALHKLHDLPVYGDMVEDQVRTRVLGVVIITTLYFVLAFTAVVLLGDTNAVPVELQPTSAFPSAMVFGRDVSMVRSPRFRLLGPNQVEFPHARFKARVARVFQLDPADSVKCSDEHIRSALIEDTLEHERVREVCTPVVTGNEVTADDMGVATFHNLRIVRGPPGLYELKTRASAVVNATDTPAKAAAVTTTLASTTNATATATDADVDRVVYVDEGNPQKVQVFSRVFSVEILTEMPFSASARVPLAEQPVLQVLDIRDRPVDGEAFYDKPEFRKRLFRAISGLPKQVSRSFKIA